MGESRDTTGLDTTRNHRLRRTILRFILVIAMGALTLHFLRSSVALVPPGKAGVRSSLTRVPSPA